MYPARFDYHTPRSLAEALDLLHQYGDDAKILAGGHSIVPAMKLRLAQPAHVIDVSGVAELRGISASDGVLDVGAFTTHWEVESSPVVREVLPYLSSVAGRIADPQVRNRGTIGGSLVHADPAADYPASVLALDAELVCFGDAGARIVPASEWFIGLMATALNEGELLGRVRFPLLEPDKVAAWVDGHCKDNPDDSLPVAARALMADFETQLPPRPPPMFVPPAPEPKAEKPAAKAAAKPAARKPARKPAARKPAAKAAAKGGK